MAGILDDLGARAQEWLAGEGIDESARRISYVADMRYHRQGYEIPVDDRPGRGARAPVSPTSRSASTRCTSSCTASGCPGRPRRSSTSAPSASAPCRSRSSAPGRRAGPDASGAVVDEQDVVFDGERVRTKIYDRAKLEPGAAIAGPAIVTEFDSTTVVLPGHQATVDTNYNILITPSA